MPTRKALAAVANALRYKRWRHYRSGGCHLAAQWIALNLGGQVVYGCYKMKDRNGPYHKTHVWAIVDGTVVDPTRGQFHGYMAVPYPTRTVYIGPQTNRYVVGCTCGGDGNEDPLWLIDRAQRSSLPRRPLEQLIA